MNQTPEVPENQNKRDFLQWILAGGVAAFVAAVIYPIVSYLIPPKQAEVEVSSVKAGKLSELEKDSGKIIKFGTKPVILIRTANGDVRAFSAVCTHLDCTVQFRKDYGMIWCACHNGKYDLNGRNISGPPPRPLDEYRVVVQGDEILISKKT
jgi:cytochrome b6-f complex iron-sulfur subunit